MSRSARPGLRACYGTYRELPQGPATPVPRNSDTPMFARYEYITEDFRVERGWWMFVKYGLGPSLLGIVLTVIVFWLWIL